MAKNKLSKAQEKRIDEKFSVFDGSQKIIKHVTYSSWIKQHLNCMHCGYACGWNDYRNLMLGKYPENIIKKP